MNGGGAGMGARAGMPKVVALVAAGLLPMLLAGAPALAQQAAAGGGIGDAAALAAGELASGRIVQLVVVLTLLSLAPGLLVMMTSFTRLVVALSFLRAGLGLQTTPANLILVSLALFMTFFIMQPTFQKAWEGGVQPLMENRISQQEAWQRTVEPFRTFMLDHVREEDLSLFQNLAVEAARGRESRRNATGREEARRQPGQADDAVPLRVLMPAFMISELRRGFEIGFLLVLPFLVIDLIVATITMSMGMMMLPPTVIAMPFKLLFFVLIDGWNLLVGGLVRSFY